jgi:hypothetical protein
MTAKMNENFNFSYSSREQNTSDTVLDCNVSFENPKSDDVVIKRLNTWLKAIGRDDIVVSPRKGK